MNQTLFQFLPQTIIGTWKSAWHIETNRIKEKYKTNNIWRIENKMIWNISSFILFPAGVYYKYGFVGLMVYLAIETVGMLLLETINYIEHYGLLRN